jgi:hypothetical protein
LGDGAACQSGEWADLIALHEFLDISKIACAHRYHRIVLHHIDLGAWVAGQAFPNMDRVQKVVSQHVREDLGAEVSLADWIHSIDSGRVPRPIERRIEGGPRGIARMVSSRLPDHPLLREAALTTANFLFRPLEMHRGNQGSALCILMNPVGIAIVRRVFGPPKIEFNNGERIVIDWGWLAEATVMASYGRIPDLREIVEAVVDEPRAEQRNREPRAA